MLNSPKNPSAAKSWLKLLEHWATSALSKDSHPARALAAASSTARSELAALPGTATQPWGPRQNPGTATEPRGPRQSPGDRDRVPGTATESRGPREPRNSDSDIARALRRGGRCRPPQPGSLTGCEQVKGGAASSSSRRAAGGRGSSSRSCRRSTSSGGPAAAIATAPRPELPGWGRAGPHLRRGRGRAWAGPAAPSGSAPPGTARAVRCVWV